MSVITLFMPITGAKQGKIKDKQDGCKASFAVISDIHMEEATDLRKYVLELGLADMADATDRLDAVVLNGDITNDGEYAQWEKVADAFSKFDVANNKILVEGNHDTWGQDDDLAFVKKTFIEFNKKISARDVSGMYYSTTIGGYPAIILGSEGSGVDAKFSETQIAWFAEQMAAASLTGKPIFVFNHQSINGTHGLPYTWDMEETDNKKLGGIGDESDQILEIIEQYENVFFISGHIHCGFTNEKNKHIQSVEKHDGYTLINLPCYMYMDVKRGNHSPLGTGYVFEVYENQLILRARNFTTGTWCTNYDVSIDITK